MQRRVWKEQADEASRPSAREHDRALDAGEQSAFFGRQQRELFRLREIAHHQGERLRLTVFALAQACDGERRGGVTGEVETAEAFHGDDHLCT